MVEVTIHLDGDKRLVFNSTWRRETLVFSIGEDIKKRGATLEIAGTEGTMLVVKSRIVAVQVREVKE